MSNIYITFTNGKKKSFLHQGRAGGSWTKSIRYEGGFAIITDEWHEETIFPNRLIKEIKVEPHR